MTNLNQLVVENSFKTKVQLELEYNCSLSQLELKFLLSAIPSSRKKIIKERSDFITGPSYDLQHLKLNILKLTNKKIYEVLTFRKIMPKTNGWSITPFLIH